MSQKRVAASLIDGVLLEALDVVTARTEAVAGLRGAARRRAGAAAVERVLEQRLEWIERHALAMMRRGSERDPGVPFAFPPEPSESDSDASDTAESDADTGNPSQG